MNEEVASVREFLAGVEIAWPVEEPSAHGEDRAGEAGLRHAEDQSFSTRKTGGR